MKFLVIIGSLLLGAVLAQDDAIVSDVVLTATNDATTGVCNKGNKQNGQGPKGGFQGGPGGRNFAPKNWGGKVAGNAENADGTTAPTTDADGCAADGHVHQGPPRGGFQGGFQGPPRGGFRGDFQGQKGGQK